jgi:FMN phosphatase YigB (HAD superfamily)
MRADGYAAMVLLLIDLDNTLVDRDAAFRGWARRFFPDPAEVEWLVRADAGGTRSRQDMGEDIKRHFGLDESIASIVQGMRDGIVESIRCYDGVPTELARLKERGARIVVVTNGESTQQRRKIAKAELDVLVDDIVISDEVGASKPDALIFERALKQSVAVPGDAWMLGDNATADIAGAQAVGIATGWVSHGRKWVEPWMPDRIAGTTVELLTGL